MGEPTAAIDVRGQVDHAEADPRFAPEIDPFEPVVLIACNAFVAAQRGQNKGRVDVAVVEADHAVAERRQPLAEGLLTEFFLQCTA